MIPPTESHHLCPSPHQNKNSLIKSVALRLRGLTDWTRLSPTVSGHGLRHLAPPISFTSRSRPHSPAPGCSYRHLSRGHPALLARSAFLLREPALLTSTQSGPRASQAGLLIQRRRSSFSSAHNSYLCLPFKSLNIELS